MYLKHALETQKDHLSVDINREIQLEMLNSDNIVSLVGGVKERERRGRERERERGREGERERGDH